MNEGILDIYRDFLNPILRYKMIDGYIAYYSVKRLGWYKSWHNAILFGGDDESV
jgi:hypothetical protein